MWIPTKNGKLIPADYTEESKKVFEERGVPRMHTCHAFRQSENDGETNAHTPSASKKKRIDEEKRKSYEARIARLQAAYQRKKAAREKL